MPGPAQPAPSQPPVVSDVVGLWDRRHGTAGTLSSGGFITLGEAGNHALYTIRLAQLLTLTGATFAPSQPMRVLDAGCGKGIFSRGLATAGLRVSAFDPSDHAIAFCREKSGRMEDYEVSTAAEYRTDRLFDLVYSIDVLFHIMDDPQWRASVQHLCGLVALGGRIALVDHVTPKRRQWSDYQMTRPPAQYHAIFEAAGLAPLPTVQCGPDGYPTVFIVGRRVR